MANLSSTRVFGDASVERSLYVKQRLGVGVGNPSERIEVGGESYPQIRFNTSDGNSTIWNVGFAGDYAFQIRNQNTSDTHVTVNPGGNVGINTTSPSYQLDVNGDINAQNTLRSSGNVVSPDNDPDAHHAVFEPADYTPVSDVEAHGNALVIDITGDADTVDGYEGSELAVLAENETFTNGLNITGGNVGIGTTSPSEKLEVVGGRTTIEERIAAKWTDGNKYGYFSGEDGNGNRGFYLGYGDGSSFIDLTLDGANNLGITGGNVGIGTTSPSQELDVSGQVEAQDYYIREDNLWLGDHVDNDDAHHPDHRDGIDYIDFNNKEQSDYNTDGRLYWDLSAGLYIKSSNANTNSPEVLWSRANVGAGSNISISYDSEGEPTISASGGNTYTDSDASLISGSSVSKNINGIGSGAPSARGYQVDWDTDFAFFGLVDLGSNNKHVAIANEEQSDDFRFYTEGNNIVTIVASSGTIRADGDVVAYYSSDRRLKKNSFRIQNPLSEISKLTGVGFDWKEESSRNGSGFGVFAQDAKKIDERLVRKQGDGYLGVDYQQLHAFEIEALKQVNENVNQNQSRIQKLEDKVERLQSKINQLKQ